MCSDGYISHNGFSSRCDQAAMATCGENVAYNKPPQWDSTVQSTHTRWMNSSGHRENILSTNFNVVGYGYHHCGDDRLYWTGYFGRK